MNYIDGFVTPVPSDKKDEYLKHAQTAADLLKEHGALRLVECWGDDVPEGKLTSFSMSVQRQENEIVVFSWMVWPSKEARDAGWEAAMADPRMADFGQNMPFDGKRMIYGGFQVILDV
ncbi:MAG: DUF1428 domain-containing protein [Formosimonas sp.]